MRTTSLPTRRAVVLGYCRLPHTVPIIAVLSATTGLTLVLGGWPPDILRLGLMLLAMLGGQLAVGVVNELTDLAHDSAAKPDKPIPAGLVSVRGAKRLMVAGLLLLVAAGPWLGASGFALVVLGNAIGVAYSLWFKRTRLAWLPYLLALPLLPLWVATCVGAERHALLLLYPFGALAVLAVYLAQSAPDVAADRAVGLRTIPTQLGERGSLLVSWGALLLSAGAMVAATRWTSSADGLLTAAATTAMVVILADGALYLVRPRRGVLLAFPACALSTAILALAWVAAIAR